ncbi:TRAP-type C4-dicarboxylate transport system permease small subunit [Lysinibacillus composti]|uniref:TRAP transporter small permease n=1 Tax=Lysinibacillus composti TaxID=720633 RepID=A0A3N9UEN4_9BACI|nr:TRAP transporter small permease [Lysinibacillus composti]MBM7608808.1 TRAP-type C4-dicarboxylate transport system permease small subunit [Lysinibacillus composti]RQW74709.1 TRAP transporter small permease [Lysinibacillus composti]
MKLYKHLDEHIETYLSATLLIFFSILCVFQVVMRYIFNESLTWSEELSRYAFVWFVYTSAAYAVRYQRHVKFNFLVYLLHKISPVYSQILKIIALFCWIAFLLFVDYYSIQTVINQFNLGQVSPANRIPMYIVYLGLPLGALLMTFRVSQHIINSFIELKRFKESH